MNVFVLIIAPAMQPIYSLLFLTWFIVLWSAGSPILHATPGCSRQPGPAHKHRILGLGEIDLYLNRLPCFVHTYHSEPSDWIDQRAQLLTLHLVTHTLPPLEATKLHACDFKAFENSDGRTLLAVSSVMLRWSVLKVEVVESGLIRGACHLRVSAALAHTGDIAKQRKVFDSICLL